MKAKLTSLILFVVIVSCKKDNILVLNGPLTDCPANSTCTYNYYNNADFTSGSQPVYGNYRVFWYNSIDNNTNACGPFTQFYFKTSLNINEFDIKSNQIAAGQVVANENRCPCCYNIAVLATKPIGGEVKGKRTDATHWLINASIILETSINHPTDTLTVNQYFTLEKIP
ncbi:MAG TPA: hypothetical protein VIM16_15150 [Mucilaginibacter sp.]|jgi:hypothetical protein